MQKATLRSQFRLFLRGVATTPPPTPPARASAPAKSGPTRALHSCRDRHSKRDLYASAPSGSSLVAQLVDHAHALIQKIQDRSAVVAVVGLGYVGLPTAVAFAEQGFRVIGADLNETKVQKLRQGVSPIAELGMDDEIARLVADGRLEPTTDVVAACREADAVLLIVPTPVDEAKQPDLRYVRAAAESAGEALRPGQLVVLESTTYPGTSDEIVVRTTEAASGLKAGVDFGVAYCPERYNPSDTEHTLDKIVRIVGAINDAWGDAAAALYGTLNGDNTHRVRDLKTAEAVKIIENIQRDLNIALTNEFALIFQRMDIDALEVLEAAATKWNFVRYDPGPGVGGHCLPVDPYYLTSVAERLGYRPRVILAGRSVNDGMPLHMVELLVDGLNEASRPVKGSKVAVLGLAYKANTGDPRESPSEVVIRELLRKGADVRLCDPWIAEGEVQRLYGLPSLDFEDAVRDADAIILMTDQAVFRSVDLAALRGVVAEECALVDGRHVWTPSEARELGFIYRGVGRRIPVVRAPPAPVPVATPTVER